MTSKGAEVILNLSPLLLLCAFFSIGLGQQTCRISLNYRSLLGPESYSMVTVNVKILYGASSASSEFTADVYHRNNTRDRLQRYSSRSKSILIPWSNVSSPELVFQFTADEGNCVSFVYDFHMLSMENFTTEFISEVGGNICLPKSVGYDVVLPSGSDNTCTCLIIDDDSSHFNRCLKRCPEVHSISTVNGSVCFSNLSATLNNSLIYFLNHSHYIALVSRKKIILSEAMPESTISSPSIVVTMSRTSTIIPMTTSKTSTTVQTSTSRIRGMSTMKSITRTTAMTTPTPTLETTPTCTASKITQKYFLLFGITFLQLIMRAL